eukprot:TRINITY_DN15735_c0_g1_i1.p1 TRINITY_DN15735_c0_g1~~TRINITY_DN15735_c0_g1_i1.p1  ORF type:complete len:327 (+),score=110.67 TRINITY_DN15735_c0_g1_i1:33-1013(+)
MSGANNESIGMMGGAYFVDRNKLLGWLSEFFGLEYKKVEECANGAAYCQIIDAVHPGKLPLHRVNFKARYDYEFIQNYKVLQKAFNKCGLNKGIDVKKLINAKYQDNLEFLQWCKKYFDINYDQDSNYNAIEKRRISMGRYNNKKNVRRTSVLPRSKSSGSTNQQNQKRKEYTGSLSMATPARVKTNSNNKINRIVYTQKENRFQSSNGSSSSSNNLIKENKKLKQQLSKRQTNYNNEKSKLNAKINNLTSAVVELEKERMYYFNKLEKIDLLFQSSEEQLKDHPDIEFFSQLQKILYNDDDDNNNEQSNTNDNEISNEESVTVEE